VTGSRDDALLEHITPFVDGELPASVAAELKRKIQDSPMHQRLVAAERATKHILKARTTRYSAPPQFAARVRAVLFETPADPKPGRVSLWRLLTQSPAVATALGTVVLGIALAVVLALFGAGRITPYIEDVYAHHVGQDRFPIQFEGDYQTVADQTTKAVGFHVPVPRLGEDLSLLGARKCQLCGHLMAFIKYSGQEGLISFFVLPKAHPAIARLDKRTQEGMTFYTASHEAVQMAFWREHGVTYCLAGSIGKDRVLALACKACRQTHEEPASTIVRLSLPPWRSAVAALAR
jgi:anti-sigma factor RsiW